MRCAIVVLMLLAAGAGVAQARCADDLKELQARVEREQKRSNPPTPQAAAAAKEMAKTTETIKNMDEVDCYNAVTRIRRALEAPPPPAQKVQK